MANITFNVAKGRVNSYVDRVVANDPATSGIIVVLLKTTATDLVLQDLATLSAILAGSSVEADFTNYARIVLTDADLSAPTVDNNTDTQYSAIPALQIASAGDGGAGDNTLSKAILCYAPDVAGADSTLIPLTAHDISVTTNGNNLNINAGTFYTGS